jgi:hypothetical protein
MYIMVEKIFKEYAEKLLNNSVLKIKKDNKTYRICEIEMYYVTKDHPDLYSHCSSEQLEFNKFYPHKFKNGTYKAGTYKCMDICYGDKKTSTYFGILIRSIKDLANGQFFTGPCLCVNELLSHYSCKEFSDFDKKYSIDKEFTIEDQKLEKEKIYIGPRVGLGEKYPDYKLKKYRYATHIKLIKKQKIFEELTT